MSLNVNQLVQSATSAASASLQGDWPKVKDVAIVEFKTLAQRIAQIAAAVADPTNTITARKAKFLIKAQVDLAAQTIVALATLTIVAVQKAIKAALGAIKQVVNTAAGFALL
jgi:hypothetical protein